MKNRINIDGTWYVPEDTKLEVKPIKVDFIFTKACTVETGKYLYTAEYDDYNRGILSIDFLNKKTKETELWDNENWLQGVYNRKKDSIDTLEESVPEPEEREVFYALVDKLAELKWLQEK